ncbi:hypothetical protein L209DRAFT_756890 [Thermothelomyces heterothallicus CBS 203.75]
MAPGTLVHTVHVALALSRVNAPSIFSSGNTPTLMPRSNSGNGNSAPRALISPARRCSLQPQDHVELGELAVNMLLASGSRAVGSFSVQYCFFTLISSGIMDGHPKHKRDSIGSGRQLS